MDRPEVTFAASVPEHGGGEQYTASFGTGWNFSKGSIVLAAQMDKLEALPVGDRDFLNCNEDRIWGKDGKRIDRQDHSILQGTESGRAATTCTPTRSSNTPMRDSLCAIQGRQHRRPVPWLPSSTQSLEELCELAPGLLRGPAELSVLWQQRRHQRATASNAYTRASQLQLRRRELEHPVPAQSSRERRFTATGSSSRSLARPCAAAWPTISEPIMPFTSDSKETVDYVYATTKLSGLLRSPTAGRGK